MSIITEVIQEQVDMIPFYIKKIEIFAKLQVWLAEPVRKATWDELEPLVASVAIWGDSLAINLTPEGFKDRSVVRFALIFGKLEKSQGYEGKSINLTAKLGESHEIGLASVTINYMPENCRLIETREELSVERRAQLEDELANGRIVFKTDCSPEEESHVEAGANG